MAIMTTATTMAATTMTVTTTMSPPRRLTLPHETIASMRLMDVDSGELSPSSETSRDASTSSSHHAHHHHHYHHHNYHEGQHHAAHTNDTRTESRGRSAALLANRTVVDEMQAFIERNSAEGGNDN
ncbi:hypothetical protein MRX96_017910 [Rhipicephalus microplus]